MCSGVHGCEVEPRPLNHEVPSSTPGLPLQIFISAPANSPTIKNWGQ